MLVAEIISSQAHYIADRTIQPIEVIEEWMLCHHLACALKYIARAARKEDGYQDLRIADWYLSRELSQFQNNFSKCQMRLTGGSGYSPEQVAIDWQLSPHLAEVIKHIRQARHQVNTRLKSLFQARTCLISEMNMYER